MNFVLSLLVLLMLALLAGAFFLWKRTGANKQVVLMLVLAAVIAANIAIWTVPDSTGEAPIGRAPETTP